MKVESPIDALTRLLSTSDFKVDREYLSFALARGVVTPEYLYSQTGKDEVLEIAEAIRDDTRATWASMKAKREMTRPKPVRRKPNAR
jgi:hypothetical protein